jgi:microcystin degradation protein MlrC
MPVDAVVLPMHGAMIADGYPDCEGDLLTRVREIVGPNVPVGVNLDPHCNLSDTMVEMADVIVCYKEWPHVDIVETIVDATRLTLDMAEGKISPEISVFDCRMIEFMNTFKQPMQGLVAEARAMEGKEGVLSVSFVHGFPWGDVPDMGSKVLIVTDGRSGHGAMLAERLGRRLFECRGELSPTYLTLSEGLEAMKRAEKFPLVVADAADMPGGGAPGDATFLLRGLIEQNIRDVAVAYQWDPMAVDIALKAGEGARLPLRIGGKSGPAAGAPLDIDVEVLRTFENLQVELADRSEQVGPAAVVRAHGIDIALETRRTPVWDWAHFQALGLDPRKRKYLVVKSANNHYAGFEEIAGDYIYISVPAACNMRITDTQFTHIQRPKWPFDENPHG